MNRKSSTPIDHDNIDRSKFPNAEEEYTPAQRRIIDAASGNTASFQIAQKAINVQRTASSAANVAGSCAV